MLARLFGALVLLLFASNLFPQSTKYDLIVTGGKIVDGSGNPWFYGDVAITGDTIVAIGKLDQTSARLVVNAHGNVVAPGFIDLMSGPDSLFADGKSQSGLRQGVTLEVFGEGESMGPLTPALLCRSNLSAVGGRKALRTRSSTMILTAVSGSNRPGGPATIGLPK